MFEKSRRRFLIEAAALAPAACIAWARDPLSKSNLGVQLYTVRNIITKDPAKVLKQIQDIGYTEVEATEGNLDVIWPALKQTSLKAVSVHTDNSAFNAPDGDQFQSGVLDKLKARGFHYVVIPFLETANGGTEGIKRIAARLNKLGAQAQAQGMTLCYHNHAHDFQPVDGTPAIERLLNETQPDLVHLEMDIFWVSVAGLDPVALLKQYSGRVPLMHLKDKAAGTPVQFSEHVPSSAFKEVGSGTLDIPAILKAADAAGVRHYFVEQDQTPNPIASLRQSYEYLSRHFA